MSDTQQVNGIEVLSRLIDGVQRSLDRQHEETKAELVKINGSIAELKGVDKTLAAEVTTLHQDFVDLKGRVERLEDDKNATRRQLDTFGHETAQAISGMRSHMTKVDSRLGRIEANDASQNNDLSEIKGAASLLVRLAQSPRVAAYVAIGSIIGGAIVAIAEKVMH